MRDKLKVPKYKKSRDTAKDNYFKNVQLVPTPICRSLDDSDDGCLPYSIATCKTSRSKKKISHTSINTEAGNSLKHENISLQQYPDQDFNSSISSNIVMKRKSSRKRKIYNNIDNKNESNKLNLDSDNKLCNVKKNRLKVNRGIKKCKKVEPLEKSDYDYDADSNHSDDMPMLYEPNSIDKARGTKKLNMEITPELEAYEIKVKKKRTTKRIKRADHYNLKRKKDQDISKNDDTLKQNLRKRGNGNKYSVTGYWYIASGYLNDIINLLEEFEVMEGWRFKDFAQCWQKKSFSLIYRGRQTFKELLEFAEEISILTMRFISPSHPIKRRIGALYTLYGLYYKFPIGHFFSLRFELEEYKNILELVNPFRGNVDNPDPAFIFRKLELKGAIIHCASSLETCYSFHNEGREFVDLEYGKQKLAKSSSVTNALPNYQLVNDVELINHYHLVKTDLTGSGGDDPQPEKALSMIKIDMLKEIDSDLKSLRLKTLSQLGLNEKYEKITVNDSKREMRKKYSEKDLVEDSVLETINSGRYAQLSRTAFENDNILKDEKVIEFMKAPSPESLINRPLKLTSRRRNKKKELEWSLNLDDIPISKTLNLQSNEADSELAQQIETQLKRAEKKRGKQRRSVILDTVGRNPENMKEKYNPCRMMTLKEEVSDEQSDLFSSTKLVSPIKKGTKALDVLVRINCGLESRELNMKINVTNKQAVQFINNPTMLQQLKKRLEPLLRSKLKGPDRNKVWLIEFISLPSRNMKIEETPSLFEKVDRSICFKKRFECLKQDVDDEAQSDASSSFCSEEENRRSNKIDLEDTDYQPKKEEIVEGDLVDSVDDRCMTDNSYSSHSDNDPMPYQKSSLSKYHKYNNCNQRILPPDSDRLIMAQNEGTVKMVALNIGGKIRYFPQFNGAKAIKKSPDKDEFTCPTWNDFSSAEAPPVVNRSTMKRHWEYSIIYPKTKSIRPIKTTADIKKERVFLSEEDDEPPLPEWGIHKKEERIKVRTEAVKQSPQQECVIEEKTENIIVETGLSIEELAGDWNDEVNTTVEPDDSSSEEEGDDDIAEEKERDLRGVPEMDGYIDDSDEEIGPLQLPDMDDSNDIPSEEAHFKDEISVEEQLQSQVVAMPWSPIRQLTSTNDQQSSSSLPQYITVNCNDNRNLVLPVTKLSQLQDSNLSIIAYDSQTPIEIEPSDNIGIEVESPVRRTRTKISPMIKLLKKSPSAVTTTNKYDHSDRSPYFVDPVWTSPKRVNRKTSPVKIDLSSRLFSDGRCTQQPVAESISDNLLKVNINLKTTANCLTPTPSFSGVSSSRKCEKETRNNLISNDAQVNSPNVTNSSPFVLPFTPKCSFLFSPKFRSISKVKTRIASGKPPERRSNKPVKFIMKGLFGRSRSKTSM